MYTEAVKKPDLLSLIFRSDYRWLTDKLRRRIAYGCEAEDVASEAFLRLASLPNLANVQEPRAMLTTLAKRVLYENWRRRDLEKPISPRWQVNLNFTIRRRKSNSC